MWDVYLIGGSGCTDCGEDCGTKIEDCEVSVGEVVGGEF